MTDEETIKIVTIGDDGIGKTHFLITFAEGQFPSYLPSVFENYSCTIDYDGVQYSVGIWDTAGARDYNRLRPLFYPNTSCFWLAFDVTNRTSFDSVTNHWIPELKQHNFGFKKDLANNAKVLAKLNEIGQTVISREEGEALASQIGAQAYVEISAKEVSNVAEIGKYTVKSASWAREMQKKDSKWARLAKKQALPWPPFMSDRPPLPDVRVPSSTFGSQLSTMINNNQFADVQLVCEGQAFWAHRVLLSIGSELFRRLFVDRLDVSSPFAAIAVQRGKPGRPMFVIALIECVRAVELAIALEFIYTGAVAALSRSPEDELKYLQLCRKQCNERNADDDDDDKRLPQRERFDAELLRRARRAAKHFQLPELNDWIDNCFSDDTVLNLSITTWLNERAGATARKLFLLQPLFADVAFQLDDGKVFFGHRALISARNAVLAPQLSGAFGNDENGMMTAVHDVASASFAQLLTFAYSMSADVEECDAVDLIAVADRFGEPRLKSLCELYLSIDFETKLSKEIARCDVDFAAVFCFLKLHRADQLRSFLTRWIGRNWLRWRRRDDLTNIEKQLDKKVLKLIEKHQW